MSKKEQWIVNVYSPDRVLLEKKKFSSREAALKWVDKVRFTDRYFGKQIHTVRG